MRNHQSVSDLFFSKLQSQVVAGSKLEATTAVVPAALFCVLMVLAMPLLARGADDVTFHKARYSTVKEPRESDVSLTVTDSKMLIQGTKENGLKIEIPYSSIDSISYEVAARHRVGEGAGVASLSPGVGFVLMATKTKSHWLDIDYHVGDIKQLTILRLDKSEYKNVIAALEARTGKHIGTLDSNRSEFNPTAGSKDVDTVIPYRRDVVASAVKSAMESVGCDVKKTKADHLECKRPWAKGRHDTERTGSGGEKVTAKLDVKGEQTRVRIETEKGFVGRLVKKNWSTPIYEAMMKGLEGPAQSPTASTPK